MTREQLESLSEEDRKEIQRAIKMGARACVFLAREIETLFTSLMAFGEGDTMSPNLTLPILEFSINPAMNTMGDMLNGMDAVDDEAGHATGPAFEMVRKVIKKYGRKSPEST